MVAKLGVASGSLYLKPRWSGRQTFALADMSDDGEQRFRLRISTRPQHPHQALRRSADLGGKSVETNRRIDIIAEDGLRRVKVAPSN